MYNIIDLELTSWFQRTHQIIELLLRQHIVKIILYYLLGDNDWCLCCLAW